MTIQGMYDAVAVSSVSTSQTHLTKLADAGFSVVMNYGSLEGSASQVLAYADFAHSVGIKIMWSLKEPGWWDGTSTSPLSLYASLASGSGASTINQFRTYVVNLVKNHPATLGYYLADEPVNTGSDPFSNVALVVSQVQYHGDQVRAADSTHPTTVAHWYQYWDWTIRIRPFVDTADWLSVGIYPLPQEVIRPLTDVAEGSAAGQAWIDGYPTKRWWSIIGCQSYVAGGGGWDPNGTRPTYTEMRTQRDYVFANCLPTVLMWWWYPDAATTTESWNDFVAAADAQQEPEVPIIPYRRQTILSKGQYYPITVVV